MYPFAGSPYSSPSQPPYSRLTGPPCGNMQLSPGQPTTGNHLPIFPSSSSMMSPMSNRPFTLTGSGFGSTQALSHQTFYSPQQSPMGVPNDSAELDSPADPISPQSDSLIKDARQQEKSNSHDQSHFFDFAAGPYLSSAMKSKPFNAPTTGNSPATSNYFSAASFPFPAAPTTGSPLYTPPIPPIHPSTLYNQYPDSSSGDTAPLTTSAQGISPYPALPYLSNRLHQKILPKLSYDSPRYKLTPERAVPLIKWFDEHKDHPYPTRHEKILLCQATQLTFTQVSTWFANARRRMKKASLEDEESKSASNCSSPKSPTSSPEVEKASIVVGSTFTTSTIAITDEQSVPEDTHKDATQPWDTTVY